MFSKPDMICNIHSNISKSNPVDSPIDSGERWRLLNTFKTKPVRKAGGISFQDSSFKFKDLIGGLIS